MAKSSNSKSPAKKSAPPKKTGAVAGTARPTAAAKTGDAAAPPRKTTVTPPNAKLSTTLTEHGFKERNLQGEDVKDADYTKGWNGLTSAKTSATFYGKGNRRVEMNLDAGGQPEVKMYKGNDVVLHSVGGHEPSPDFWTSYMKD